jgi:hypothetical protein
MKYIKFLLKCIYSDFFLDYILKDSSYLLCKQISNVALELTVCTYMN